MKLMNSGFFLVMDCEVSTSEWMDVDQPIYDDRTWTWRPRKPNHTSLGNWPRIVRTWSVAANFPIFFCRYFQTRTNQRKPPMFSKPIISYALLLDTPPPASPGLIISDQNLPEASHFVFTVKLPHSSVCHWVFAKHKRWWLTPLI